ncbi:MAG: helix-hairpin-helix domain-containing protein [Elusimicrobia bacterium]|nr:helix-hairpin-helix domain-containing protein [Elusimicrobiota bacterium]
MKNKFLSIIIYLIIVFLLLSINICLYSYENEPDDLSLWESDSDIEEAYQSGDIEYDEYEKLLTIYNDKIDINTADVFQLQTLPGLTPFYASKIVEYRLKHDYYKNINELVSLQIIDNITYDKIKIFIVAEQSEGMKTTGDIILMTKSNSYVEINTTGYPRTYDLLRLRLKKFNDYLRFGAIVEGDTRYENYYYTNECITDGEFVHSYRINKSYIGYEGGPVIEQAYIGNFRAGFGQGLTFDNSGKSSPNGLYPDDSYSKQTQTTVYTANMKDKYVFGSTPVNLKGLGGRIKQERFDLTGFYSRSKYPLKTLVYMDDDKTHYVTVEDVYEERLIGTNFRYKILEQTGYINTTHIGATLYTSKRKSLVGEDIDIQTWRWPPERSFAVYGADFTTGCGYFNIACEASKVRDWGSAWYIKIFKRTGGLDMIYSHRDYDVDFYNSWARGYSKHTDLAKFRNRDEKGDFLELSLDFLKVMRLKLSFDQFKHVAKIEKDYSTGLYYTVYETPTVDREINLKYNWRLPHNVQLQIDRKLKDKDIYKKEEFSEKMTVTTACRVKVRPSKVTCVSVRYSYIEDYYDISEKYKPKDEVKSKLTYDITDSLEISGELKFSDSDLNKSGKESRQYVLQIRNSLSKNAEVKVCFRNRYRWSEDEFVSDEYFTATDAGYINRWEIRMDYKW